MKQTFTLLFIICIAGIAFGQGFEGKIIYHNTYTTKLHNVSDLDWNRNMGTMEEYIINDSDYRITTNGWLFEWQVYNNKPNRVYTKMSNSDYILWNDGAVDDDSVINVEVKKSDTVVLGYKCTEVVLTCVSGTQKYYFNNKLKINTKVFSRHKFGNLSQYLNAANALPLKTIIDAEQYTLISTAVEIKPMHIDKKEFILPAGAKTVKNNY